MRRLLSTIGVVLIFGTLLFLPHGRVFAETTPFRSAHSISTAPTTSTTTAFINLENCSETDGLTCDRIADSKRGGSLYFTDFDDFGIPDGSTITHVRIRVTGFAGENMYIGVYGGKSTAYAACQHPTWRWQVYLPNTSPYSVHNEYESMSNGSLDYCLSLERIRTNNFMFYLHWASTTGWSANIDNFEIAFDYTPPVTLTPTSTITPTPTQTPTPTPIPPEPFLDLPWEYKKYDLSFAEAALAINSYFDHKYPFLCCAILQDSPETVNYLNKVVSWYSSHDGYDWGTPALVEDGDPVLAAADGIASFVADSNSGGGGNVVKIAHENGYQTIYEHLYFDDHLAVQVEKKEVEVNQGQRIGTVGHTGNCYIEYANGQRIYNSPDCAHIHFSVVQDKEFTSGGTPDFSDNMPDGLTDPFGWQSEELDPWEHNAFTYKGKETKGNKSYYLWREKLGGLDESLPTNGGIFSVGKHTVKVPEDTVEENSSISIKPQPWVKVSEVLQSIGSTIDVIIKNSSGDIISSFGKPIEITIKFSEDEITRYNLDTLSIYSSNDGGSTWNRESTFLDLETLQAVAQVTHLTQFALMAERKDFTPPITSVDLTGIMGKTNKFQSNVLLTLSATDSADSIEDDPVGVKRINYKLNNGEWSEYVNPIVFSDMGNYLLTYYSSDNDGNIEESKTVDFSIDTTFPEVEIEFNSQDFDIVINGTDSSGSASVTSENLGRRKTAYIVEDEAGNTTELSTTSLNIGKLKTLHVDNLVYQDEKFNFDRNILAILYSNDRRGNLTGLFQTFYQEGHEVVILSYTKSSDKTKVTVKERGREKVVEELEGMKILQLYTDRGTLKYRY